MDCNICHYPSKFLFSTVILGRHTIQYNQCDVCGFIQTETPYWLNEAYVNPVNLTDVGLLSRNLFFADYLNKFITHNLDPGGKFLDYGGGYGILVRMMRDKGFDFWLEERYCENLFAKHLTVESDESNQQFELITAIEVFEHLTYPMAVIKHLLSRTDHLFFSTVLVPETGFSTDWWYLGLEHGQHISFFNLRTLEYIAEQLGCQLFTNQANLHFLTRNKNQVVQLTFKEPNRSLMSRIKDRLLPLINAKQDVKQNRTSLLAQDVNYYFRLLEGSTDD